MAQYYYTIASLPMLKLGEKPPYNRMDFLAFCREQLSPDDYLVLEQSAKESLKEKSNNSLLRNYKNWEINLRNELAKLRSLKTKIEAEAYLVQCEEILNLKNSAREAVNQINPLEAENFLAKLRWNFLEESEIGHFFDLEKILVYFLKLQLLEEVWSLNKIKGEENFTQINKDIEEKIKWGEPS